jgi:hypothetical protein
MSPKKTYPNQRSHERFYTTQQISPLDGIEMKEVLPAKAKASCPSK